MTDLRVLASVASTETKYSSTELNLGDFISFRRASYKWLCIIMQAKHMDSPRLLHRLVLPSHWGKVRPAWSPS